MFVIDLLAETLRGKSLGRILCNQVLRQRVKPEGRIFDLASGQRASYYRYLPVSMDRTIKVDLCRGRGVDLVADLEQPLPFKSGCADTVFLFRVLYVLRRPEATLKEVRRMLRRNGVLYLTSPFVFNEAREPNDFWRFTGQKLQDLVLAAGFAEVELIPVGERFSAAANLLASLIPLALLRAPLFLAAAALDSLVPPKMRRTNPCPLTYLVVARVGPGGGRTP